MIAVFIRHTQPNYGNGEWSHHGYSVIFVRCANRNQVSAVRQKLAVEGLPEPFGHTYDQGWYGSGKGAWDLVGLFPGNKLLGTGGGLWLPYRDDQSKCSVGDNRYVGVYEAKELLDV